MKKLMFAIAAVAAGAAFADEPTAIQSANIVGYTTQTYVGGKWLIGATPFQNTNSSSLELKDLVKGFATTDSVIDTVDNMMLNNPYIQIQNKNQDGSLAAGTKDWFWCADAYMDEEGYVQDAAWADQDGCAAGGPYNPDVVIAPGTAYWFKDPSASTMTLTLAGQVVSDNTADVNPTMNKWNLICNPFPVSIDLNSAKIAWTGITQSKVDTVDNMMVNNPYIQIQNRNDDGTLAAGTKDWFWCEDAYLDEDGLEIGPAWADQDGCAAGGPYNPDIKIPSGAGFWFKDPSSSVTITWSK